MVLGTRALKYWVLGPSGQLRKEFREAFRTRPEGPRIRGPDLDPSTSTHQLPFKEPQIPSNRVYKALNRGTLGGLGNGARIKMTIGKGSSIFWRHPM